MPRRMPPHPLVLSATVPPPASPPPAPKCSSCSTGLPSPPPPSTGPDWGQVRPVISPPLPFPAPVLALAFRSTSPPAPPSLPWNPAAPGRETSPLSSSVRSSFENCYSFSRVDLLICNLHLRMRFNTHRVALGDRPSHLIFAVGPKAR